MASAVPELKPNSSKNGPTTNVRPNRLPAPTLFVGPPSRNASQLSLSRQVAEGGGLKPMRESLNRQKSSLLSKSYDQSEPKSETPQLKRPSERSVETKWREMQSTLDEVEFTAQSSTHVFGEKHSQALDELRKAQVELARAWGRGNDESLTPDTPNHDSKSQRKRGNTAASASTQLSGESEVSTAASSRSNIGDETAEDIRLATERRAQNEAYFKRVDENVKLVVAKLEAVAEAMRGVEGESRSLWSGTSTSETDLQAARTDSVPA